MAQNFRSKACCIFHSNCNKELIFDFDCNRVLCLECRKPPDTHTNHKKEMVSIVLTNADAQIEAICNSFPQLEATLKEAQQNRISRNEKHEHLQETEMDHRNSNSEVLNLKLGVCSTLFELSNRFAKMALEFQQNSAAGPQEWSVNEAEACFGKLKQLIIQAKTDENVSLASENKALCLSKNLQMWMKAAKSETRDMHIDFTSTIIKLRASIQKCSESINTVESDVVAVQSALSYLKNQSDISNSRLEIAMETNSNTDVDQNKFENNCEGNINTKSLRVNSTTFQHQTVQF